MDVRVISIGALAAHGLWGEREPVRTGHSTTTLIRSGDAVVLTDPGLPGAALVARLRERAGIVPGDVTHVFLTSFRPDVRRGIEAFEGAEWLIGETEREAVGVPLAQGLRDAASGDGPMEGEDAAELRSALERDVAVLRRCEPAPDRIAPGIDLFPLPGVTPGLCGLLIPSGRGDVLVCGDAVATAEHLDQGKVLQNCYDIERARESFREAIEIADLLVLGRDNMVLNPTRRPF